MPQTSLMTEWKIQEIEVIPEVGNLECLVQDRASNADGSIPFVSEIGTERGVKATQRIITVAKNEGNNLLESYPATIGIQREVLTGKGELTGVQFTGETYGARYEASLRGEAIEAIRNVLPGLTELFIYTNVTSELPPLGDTSVNEKIQTLSLIGNFEDGGLRVIDIIDNGDPYEIITQIGEYLHTGIYQKLYQTAYTNKRLMNIIRDVNEFCFVLTKIADEIRNRTLISQQFWIPRDITKVSGIMASQSNR